MPESLIGAWVARQRAGKAHFCESEIEDRYVTRCGHQLARDHGRRGRVTEAAPDRARCLVCKGG